MNKHMNKRIVFCPNVPDARLEERVVMSSSNLAPLPAPPPFNSNVLVEKFGHPLTVTQLRAAYLVQVRVANSDLQNMVHTDIQQLYSSGSVPTAQQQTDFEAMVGGALDATALRLSSQASLLPDSGRSLVPAIQNELLGSGSTSLASRLSSLAQSGRFNGSAGKLQSMSSRQIKLATEQNIAEVNHYFKTTAVNSLSVNSSNQPISLKQFVGGQLVSQFANTLGSLAQSFPNVANSTLFPNGTTSTVDQSLLDTFTSQSNSALSTAAFQIGSALELFPGFSNVTAQLQPMLFNSTTNTNSLVSTLENLDFGGTGFNTAVSSAFNSGFQNVVSAVSPFFGVQAQSNLSLPTDGFTNLFGSQFSDSNFNSGFNNGFVTGTSTGFTGFGMAPTSFNTNFSTGFNSLVSTVDQNLGLLGSTGTVGGVPVQSR
jgi:hypothetical protein